MKWLRVGEEEEKKDVHVFANFRLGTYSGKVSLIVFPLQLILTANESLPL